MDIIEAITVAVGEEEITPSIYKLLFSHVFLVDLSKHLFADGNGEKVKINLKFTDRYKTYWCKFQCGISSVDLIGHHSVVFSGFPDKNCRTNRVRAYKLNDSTNLLEHLDEETKRRINSTYNNENNVVTVTYLTRMKEILEDLLFKQIALMVAKQN